MLLWLSSDSKNKYSYLRSKSFSQNNYPRTIVRKKNSHPGFPGWPLTIACHMKILVRCRCRSRSISCNWCCFSWRRHFSCSWSWCFSSWFFFLIIARSKCCCDRQYDKKLFHVFCFRFCLNNRIRHLYPGKKKVTRPEIVFFGFLWVTNSK